MSIDPEIDLFNLMNQFYIQFPSNPVFLQRCHSLYTTEYTPIFQKSFRLKANKQGKIDRKSFHAFVFQYCVGALHWSARSGIDRKGVLGAMPCIALMDIRRAVCTGASVGADRIRPACFFLSFSRPSLTCLVVFLCLIQGCSSHSQPNQPQILGNQTLAPATDQTDDSEVLRAQAARAIKVEVTVKAPVKKLLRDDVEGLPHQKFLIVLSNGSTVLIAHDLKMAPRVDIQPGDIVCIHGEYIWNKLGGLIHWTHHSDTPYHDNGWIDFNGVRYQ